MSLQHKPMKKHIGRNRHNKYTHTHFNHLHRPRRSVVEISFEGKYMTLAYYNDKFDLHIGDLVYVDGKLEGLLGRVISVNYNFKIKLSDYKRVIALVDTTVKGQFFTAGPQFITFDREAIPRKQVLSWFKPPFEEDDDFVSGNDDSTFSLDNLISTKFTSNVFSRGCEYHDDNRVKYISLDGSRGYAIVEGSQPYEVEFQYKNGEISHLVCSCYCSYNCKHEVAVLLNLREILKLIETHYSDEYENSGYFAAINKATLMYFAIGAKEKVSFTL